MPSQLDAIDLSILEILRENADLPNKFLADQVGLSPSACLRRVSHLKKIGAIQKIVAVVDPECFERRLAVIVTVKFERHGSQVRQKFFDQLAKEKAISQSFMVTGEIGCVLVLHVADMEEYTELVDRLFHDDKNVAAFTTHMVMSKLK